MPRRGDWPDNPIIYQIYPRSFLDTSGTGEGDLRGILERLPYLAELGVDAIWLSPFYTSPFCDGGYDVADHCAVDPRFGTLADFDAIVECAHDLGLRVMVDLVLNHTSETHDWFARSLAREEGYEDVYVWADAKPDGSPPSNWISFFGQPAWQWHPQRGQYCLSKFLPCQPCLNHDNDRVSERVRHISEFWLARGVDGFRYDAVTSFFHDPELRDNPPASAEEAGRIPGPSNNPYTFQAHVHDVLPDDCAAFAARLREMAGPDAFLFGEVNNGPRSVELTRAFTKEGRLDAGYGIDLPQRGPAPAVLRDLLDRLDGEGGFAWWMSCHDQPRHVSAHGDGGARDARMFALLLAALPGPLLLFQGEELGQPQARLDRDELHDPFDRMYWPDPIGRDGARTPMAWDDTLPRCGFGGATPWLPIQRAEAGGAAQQQDDPASVLSLYRRALKLRREYGLADARLKLMESPDDVIDGRIEDAIQPLRFVVNLGESPHAVTGLPDQPVMQSAAMDGPRTLPPRSAAWWVPDSLLEPNATVGTCSPEEERAPCSLSSTRSSRSRPCPGRLSCFGWRARWRSAD